jgi:hypothetical protein
MGLVFGIGRRDARETREQSEGKRSPYRLASYEQDHEGKRFKSSNVVYSFWSAAKYTLILSLMLWWLPMFGQMIAGYVGGRRAGGPWKGVAAAIVPVVCLYSVMTAFAEGYLPSHMFGVAIAPSAISAALSTQIPLISPYIQFSSEYVNSFVNALAGVSPYGINMYVITVAFAYVGGVLAEQNRREIEFSSGAVMSSTTVLVADNAQQYQLPQYQYAARPGLAHTIGSVFPWGRHEPKPAVVHANARIGRRHHDSWARAVDLRYDDEQDYDERPMLPPSQQRAGVNSALSGGSAPRHQQRMRTQRGDPWQRSQRRAKQQYSSASRFSDQIEPRYELPRRDRDLQGYHHHHNHGRNDRSGYIPGDVRSIHHARREIDREWGRAASRVVLDEGDEPAAAAVSADREVRHNEDTHKRERHGNTRNWDSI